MRLSISAALAALVTIALAGSAAAQAPTRAPAPADTVAGVRVEGLAAILLGELLLETERGADSAAARRVARASGVAARGYRRAAGDAAATGEVLARAIANHFSRRPEAGRTDDQLVRLLLLQAAQHARLIEQNDRMIELLETMAVRK
jgi:hypothetical protein